MTMEQLRDKVHDKGGVLTVSMLEVRDAFGADRLGQRVREEIQRRLRRLGLRHFPENLPSYQECDIRLFLADGPVDDLIRACNQIGSRWDERIREAASNDASEKLDKIRKVLEVPSNGD